MPAVNRKKKILRIRRKHTFLKIILSVVVLAGLSLAAIMLIGGNGTLSLDGMKRLFGMTGGETTAVGFSFDTGFNNVYADMNGGFAVASTVGVQVFNGEGEKAYTEIYGMSDPAVAPGGPLCAAYDLGGKALKVFDTAGILGGMQTDNSIISATLNPDGWLAVCTQAGGGYKSYVYVYKNGAYDFDDYVFWWKSGVGYVLSAVISPDDKNLAVVTYTDAGSRIVFFSLESMEETGSCTLDGRLALDIRFTGDGRILAVCQDAFVAVTYDGASQVLRDYEGRYLTGWSAGKGFTAIALSDYMVGEQGRIVTVDEEGNNLGTLETQSKVLSVSARGDYLAVLYGDGFAIYDKNLNECARNNNTAGVQGAIMRSDGKALLISSHSASVFSTTAD